MIPITALEVSAFVEVTAGDVTGIGWSYTDAAAAGVVHGLLREHVIGWDALAVRAIAIELGVAIRNVGRRGIAAAAVSAVDIALWDLKAKLLSRPLHVLLDPCRTTVPLYGSGGFTPYDDARLRDQLGGWVAGGFRAVKMKIGATPADDLRRVGVAREAVGDAELMVDANGAYHPKRALQVAHALAALDVAWFEEPVSSDDLDGLRLLREHGPPGMDITAGEYGWGVDHFRALLAGGCVDVLQADATRCLGITGFLGASALAEAWHVPLSAHTAPTVHLAACCAAPTLVHLEYFHDHARLERLLFDGVVEPVDGALTPTDRPGLGVTFKRADAARFAVGAA